MMVMLNISGLARGMHLRLPNNAIKYHCSVMIESPIFCCVLKKFIFNFYPFPFPIKYLGMCPNLMNPANGQVTESGFTPGDNAAYTCNSGYQLVGDSPRTCQDNGQWSGTAPTCEQRKYVLISTKLT